MLVYVLSDVTKAVDRVHATGQIYIEVLRKADQYLNKQSAKATVDVLLKLKRGGKKLFLLTNSPFYFVNGGMEYLTAGFLPAEMSSWRDIFDLIFTSCSKPGFFKGTRPFRTLAADGHSVRWDACTEFKKDEIYLEGSLAKMVKLTGWKGNRVLYFGDHLSNDVKEPSLAGWQTGVIIEELETEVKLQNSAQYRGVLAELLELDRLSSDLMLIEGDSTQRIVSLLKTHREYLRYCLKSMFNPHFGSVFRTHKNATSFAYDVQRYANVYTSKVENFLRKTFYYFYTCIFLNSSKKPNIVKFFF